MFWALFHKAQPFILFIVTDATFELKFDNDNGNNLQVLPVIFERLKRNTSINMHHHS
jgi:hypothetical protein